MIDTMAPMKSIIMIHVTWLSLASSVYTKKKRVSWRNRNLTTELMVDVKLVDGGVINQQTWLGSTVLSHSMGLVLGKYSRGKTPNAGSELQWFTMTVTTVMDRFQILVGESSHSMVCCCSNCIFSANIFHYMISLSQVSSSLNLFMKFHVGFQPVVKLHFLSPVFVIPFFLLCDACLWCICHLVHLPLTPNEWPDVAGKHHTRQYVANIGISCRYIQISWMIQFCTKL